MISKSFSFPLVAVLDLGCQQNHRQVGRWEGAFGVGVLGEEQAKSAVPRIALSTKQDVPIRISPSVLRSSSHDRWSPWQLRNQGSRTGAGGSISGRNAL